MSVMQLAGDNVSICVECKTKSSLWCLKSSITRQIYFHDTKTSEKADLD